MRVFSDRIAAGVRIALLIAISNLLGLIPCFAQSGDTARADQEAPDELSLGDLLHMEISKVLGASTYEQDVTRAPSSITIVTAQEIKRFGYRTLAEALNGVKGVYLSYDRNYHYVGMRGFLRPGDYNDRVLVLIDGMPINDNVYNGVLIGTGFPIDIELVDRIEVIRGPASSLYGTCAFFGVVNVVTRNGSTFAGHGVEASGGVGSYQTYSGRGSLGRGFGSQGDVVLSVSAYDSKGPDLYFEELDDSLNNFGTTSGTDYDHQYQLLGKATLGGYSLAANYSLRRKGIPTGSWGMIFNDERNNSVDAFGTLRLGYEHAFDGNLTLAASAAHRTMDYDGEYVYDYSAEEDRSYLVVNKDIVRGQQLTGDVRVTKGFADLLTIVGGLSARYDADISQLNYDEAVYSDDQRTGMNGAAYLQGELSRDLGAPGEITVNAGVRYDYYQTFGSTVNPRVALIYGPFDKTAIKLLYGSAFRAPNAYELYYRDGSSTKDNPDLGPEKIRTFEGAWEQYAGRYVRTSVAGFYYLVDDLITQQEDPSDNLQIFRNADRVAGHGVELEVEGRFRQGVSGLASYTYDRTYEKASRVTLTNCPQHVVKARVSVPVVKDRVFVSPELHLESGRQTLADDTTSFVSLLNLTLLGRNLINAGPLKGLELSASVYNVFDRAYGHPGANEHPMDIIEQDGRTFRAGIAIGF